MDFYWRLYWQDNRLAMPEFWKRMSKTIQKNGIELTMLLTNDSVGMWVPDIRFHDVAQIDYIVEVSLFTSFCSTRYFEVADCVVWLCGVDDAHQCLKHHFLV